MPLNTEVDYNNVVIKGTVELGVKGERGLQGFKGDQGIQGPPVPVAHELGDDPDLAVSQKLLTDSIADMEQSNEAAVIRAEAASDAAFVNADVYPDVAAGLAAVADGEQFQVLSDEGLEYRRYRKDSATVATEVGGGFPTPKLVEGAVQQAENAADRAETAADSVKPYVDNALSDLSTAASKFYPTLALANADIANILVNQPIHVGEAVNGGLWYKATSGATALTKSGYDPLTQAKKYTDSKVATDNSDELAHAFIDAESKLLASIDVNGKFDFDPSEETKERLGVLVDNGDTDYAFLFVDAENKVLGGWDKFGSDLSSRASVEPTNNLNPAPLTHEKDAVEITDFSRVIEKLNINTVAKGRTTDPDIVLEGNGFTHPKLVYVPEGWNGYKYWLATTPTFGITPSDAYENPHVFCSNDMLTWLEPTGAPLDLPDPSSSVGFWSDTHLVIDDDGWMYCIYRGNYFYGHTTAFIVARKSRDGINWSDRIPIYDPVTGGVGNGILSPAIYKSGSKWQYIDILKDPEKEGDFQFNTNYGRGVFRRSADTVTGDYGTYTLDHLVNITNRPWGEDKAPWHIDAIKVGNLYLLLLAVGGKTQSYSHELYLCWSTDGWNYTAFDKLNTLFDNCYRSSISFRDYKDGKINFDVIVSRTTGFNGGNLDLFNLTLETK